ncbi:MAG TPA: helix-turn-helix domain-containing protein [Streptosporangiaceae bacterium]
MSTRDRILDIAMDLFIEQGFDKTSLREIADQLGFSKAAIYYHFESKDEILLALHMRLHEIGRRAMERFGETPASLEAWAQLLDGLIDEIFENRRLILMHQRNSSAFRLDHAQDHEEANQDMEEMFRRVFSDPAVPLRDRVRMVAAVGAIMAGLVLSGDLLKDVPTEELADLVRDAIGDLLVSPSAPRRAAPRSAGPGRATPRRRR